MLIKRGLSILFCCICIINADAQQDDASIQEMRKVPIAPTPNAAALGKFGEIPVKLSTGIPSIGIPFYTYKNERTNLQLSVGIQYHAGGHKVEDMASNVGLGWALNAGGLISRTMRGRPDDELNGYIYSDKLPYLYTSDFNRSTVPSSSLSTNGGICSQNSSDYLTVKNVSENELDGESDIFHFNMGNFSGEFFFKKDGTIQLMSQSNLKISYSRTSTPGLYYIDEFVITDDKGCKYFFNQKEWMETVSSLGGSLPVMPTYVSTWHLTKILAPDGQNAIDFVYRGNSGDLEYEGAFSDSYRSTVQPSGGGDIVTGTQITQSFSYIYTHYGVHLGSISFPDNTSVSFDYQFAREDYVGDSALTAVHIKQDGIDKYFTLSYDYFVTPTCYSDTCTKPIAYTTNDWYKRLRLLSVKESSSSDSLPPYLFEYNPKPLPTRNSKAQDWWGYFNGEGTNGSLISTISVPGYPGGILGGADRPPSEENAKAAVLEKMTYPTGGYTSFQYELNDGYYDTQYMAAGGLRVKRTTDYDPVSGNTIITSYSYQKEDASSSGVVKIQPNFSWYWTAFFYNAPSYVYNYFLNETSSPGQTLSFSNGSPVVYTRVKVSKDSSGIANGYTISNFTGSSFLPVIGNSYPVVPFQDFDFGQGELLKETNYNSSNQKISSTENQYDLQTIIPVYPDTLYRNLKAALLHWDDQATPNMNMYGARTYFMGYGRNRLTKTIQKTYDADSCVTAETNYYYDNSNYFQPTRSIFSNSQGQQIQNTNKFAHDLSGQAVYDSMIARNMISIPLDNKTSNLANGKTIQWVKNNFSLSGNLPRMATQQSFNRSDSSWITEVTVHNYDNRSNILDLTPISGITSAYIWNDNGAYPAAVCNNAAYGSIAYSSFETAETGNWDYPSAGVGTGDNVTGKNYFNLYPSRQIERSSLDAGKTYIISYWLKDASGSVAINSGSGGDLKTARNGWTLYEREITGTTTITITGSGIVDELRLFPKSAQMTTYTYEPLLGITSQCDQNNHVIYYEYDGLGRLLRIKDENKNILKRFEYGYQQ